MFVDIGCWVIGNGIFEGVYVGNVINFGLNMVVLVLDFVIKGMFILVDKNDNFLIIIGVVLFVKFLVIGVLGYLVEGEILVLIFDVYDVILGGGIIGLIFIFFYIKFGIVSFIYYNYFFWLWMMEDIFFVFKGKDIC